MNKSDSIKSLAEALAKAQADFSAVPFNATNPFLKNKYADLGAIIQSAKPVLAKHGLSVSQLAESEAGSIGVTTMLMHSSGEWVASTISLPISDEKGKSSAQVAGSVITYLRRYALASVLGLYADEDGDGNTPVSHSITAPKPETKPVNDTVQLHEKGEITDGDGKAFKDMDKGELIGHLNAYVKRLRDNPNDEETLRKRDEAKFELDSRNGK